MRAGYRPVESSNFHRPALRSAMSEPMPDAVVLRRWPHREPPAEEALSGALCDEGMEPLWWSNGPGDTYGPHTHDYHKVLYCSSGTITFTLSPTNERLTLGAGDRMDLPAGWEHAARVGPNGCRCVEGWRRSSGAEQPSRL